MLPSLARLTPTGTSAAQEVLEKRDLFGAILHAIAQNDADLACKLAITWCDLNSEHRDACKDAWEDLADRVFPNTARLRALFARVPKSDARKVFVGLCNTKHILRVIYAQHVYFQLERHLSFTARHRHVGSIERLRILDAFKQTAKGWWESARRAESDLQWDDPSRRPYYLVLNAVEPPFWRIRDFVDIYSGDAINWAIDWGRNANAQNADRFVFEVSIEDKHQAMEALIDACVEAALDLLEQGHDLSGGDRPPAVTDPLKEKLRAPLANVL
jgi:hypothetical protein